MSTPTATAPMNSQPSLSDQVLGYLDRGLALPRKFYTDGDLYALELQAVFGRQWLYAGHVSQVPNAGDYLKLDIGDESAIVVRDRDGEIHALLNVCRHRGARLVDEPCGKLRRLVCPYHQWSYRHDGTLAGAPRMPESFDKSQFPLKRVHSAIWNGLIFVNFSAEPEDSLPNLLGDSSQLMEPFDIASAKIAHTETYEVAANWKLVWENSQECYHCNANHPEFIRTFDLSAMDTPDVAPVRSFTDDRRMQFGSFPLKTGAVSLTMTGEPASRLLLGKFSDGLEPYTAATHLKPGFAAVFS
jgi:Rieske 2Fe-2S family protein